LQQEGRETAGCSASFQRIWPGHRDDHRRNDRHSRSTEEQRLNFSALGSGNAMSAYVSTLLAKAKGTDATGVEAGSKGDKLMKAAADAALAAAAKNTKVASNQRQLESKAAALSTELQAALKSAGVKLGASVEFSVSTKGTLAIKGSEKDVGLANTFLENDKSAPSFAARLAALTEEADALSQTIRQSAAISQAARYAGNSTGVLSLYGSLLQRQDSSPAVFTLGTSGGSLTYPGILQSKA
jgi:hypothetical protein